MRFFKDAHHLTVVAPANGSGGVARSESVRSAVLEGRAVLYAVEPSRIIELDESHTLWWLLLDGTSFDDIVDEVAQETGLDRQQVLEAGETVLEGFRTLRIIDG